MSLLSSIEFWGNLTGLLCVLLAARENIWSMPVGLINCVLFGIMFYNVQLYPDTTLQVIFFILTAYGWIHWLRGDKNLKDVRKSRHMTFKEIIITLVGILGGAPLVGLFYATFTAAALPYVDSFILVASLFAQWFLSKKVVETWILWILIDIIAVPLYFSRELTGTGYLYILFFINAIYGLISWYKLIKEEENTIHHQGGIGA